MKISSFENPKILGTEKKSAKKFKFNQFSKNTVYFCFQADGEGCVSSGGNKQIITPGCVFTATDGSEYTLLKGSKSTVICIAVETATQADSSVFVYNTQSPLKTEELFNETISIYTSKLYNSEYLCLANIYKILASTLPSGTMSDGNEKNVIAPSINFIFTNIYNPDLSLEVACDVAGISRVYFNRLFLQTYNITPTKFINNIRIEKACYLLKSDIYTREEIAVLSGFSNLKYFYTVFKGITGCTTGQYRKNIRN